MWASVLNLDPPEKAKDLDQNWIFGEFFYQSLVNDEILTQETRFPVQCVCYVTKPVIDRCVM